MSRAYNGGSKVYTDENTPNEIFGVLQILQRFIEDEFTEGEAIAEDISRDNKRRLIMFATSDENESPATLGRRDDELVAYGAFSYEAENHDIQNIWENRFEIRETENGVYVRVSDWYGTAADTWAKKIEQDTLYV